MNHASRTEASCSLRQSCTYVEKGCGQAKGLSTGLSWPASDSPPSYQQADKTSSLTFCCYSFWCGSGCPVLLFSVEPATFELRDLPAYVSGVLRLKARTTAPGFIPSLYTYRAVSRFSTLHSISLVFVVSVQLPSLLMQHRTDCVTLLNLLSKQ